MKKYLIYLLIFVHAIYLCADDKNSVNEYYQKKEVKELIDKILQNAGGEENISKADSATYEAIVNMNLIGLKISYQQKVKRHQQLFKMDKDILGEKITTGFDGSELYQSAYGKLFKIPEYKQTEIQFMFQSSMPHQYVLKLKKKDFALKYLGIQDISGQKLMVFQHLSEIGEEKHCFDPETLNPVLSLSTTTGLQWQVTRDNFKQQDGVSYPVIIRMKLNQEELYHITVMNMNFTPIDAGDFKKPNLVNANVVLQPFAAQIRLKEIHKALQLYREYDPINHSYPPPEKVKSIMGVQPQIANPSQKIGEKGMFTYELFRGAVAERLEFETYPYILKGNVHKYTPIVWDKKDNYKTGRNVLFADGSVQYITETQFDSYYQASLKRYPIIQVELEKE